MVKSDKPEVIEQDVFGGKEKAVPGVVGRVTDDEVNALVDEILSVCGPIAVHDAREFVEKAAEATKKAYEGADE